MSVRAPRRRSPWHDAFDAQMALWRWYRSPMGRLYMEDSLRTNAGALEFTDTRSLIVQLYGAETSRLLDTDPIFVSAEMCEVTEAASQSFAPEPLLETDLITPRGFLYFERPFTIPDRFESPTTIAGASWSRLFNGGDPKVVEAVNRRIVEWAGKLPDLEEQVLSDTRGIEPWGIGLTIYCSTDFEVEQLKDDEESSALRIRKLYGNNVPPMVPMHITPWYFNMTFAGNEWDETGKSTGAEWWWRIIQTSYRLMQQKIAVKYQQPPERHMRKEAKKIGISPDINTVVVRLRREAEEKHEPTGKSANYSHRFIVGGHWRLQPYPIQGISRQIWISPFIKGPKDRPLIVKPKRVYQWDR